MQSHIYMYKCIYVPMYEVYLWWPVISNGTLLHVYMYMYVHEVSVTHLFHVRNILIFFYGVQTRYWKKWTCHYVNDPKDLTTAQKKSTTSCCHIAGLMNLISAQGSACWRRWLMRLDSKLLDVRNLEYVVCTYRCTVHGQQDLLTLDSCIFKSSLCPAYLTIQNINHYWTVY